MKNIIFRQTEFISQNGSPKILKIATSRSISRSTEFYQRNYSKKSLSVSRKYFLQYTHHFFGNFYAVLNIIMVSINSA